MKIIIEDHLVEQIPVLTIANMDKSSSSPAIIYLHGYGGDKEEVIDFGYMLARKGINFISFDCQDHGERLKTEGRIVRKFDNVYPEDTGIDTYIHMHEIIEQSGEDIKKVIQYATEILSIDPKRIGLTGFSMGAFATFYNAANNDQIKAAVPIAGKPSFSKAWEDVMLATSTYDQWKNQMTELEEESEVRFNYIKKLDPYEKMKSFAPRPLHIINGDQDTAQIYLYALELYKELLPLYKGNRDRIKISMPFVGHRLTYEMKEEAVKWFVKYL